MFGHIASLNSTFNLGFTELISKKFTYLHTSHD